MTNNTVRSRDEISHGDAIAAMVDEAKRRWSHNELHCHNNRVSPSSLAHWYEDVSGSYEELKDAGLIADAKDAIGMVQESDWSAESDGRRFLKQYFPEEVAGVDE